MDIDLYKDSLTRYSAWCKKMNRSHTHTHTHRKNNTPDTDTQTHDKNNTRNPQTNTSHKHLTTLEGGATTVQPFVYSGYNLGA